MKSNFSKTILFLLVISFSLPSCLKDLNQSPFYGLNSTSVYAVPSNYVHVLAKLYAALALTGDQGPAGNGDITGFDEGSSGMLRSMYNLQELPTDEAVCCWNDPGISDLHYMIYNSQDPWVKYTYYRIYFLESLCNEFIRASSDSAIAGHGFADADASQIKVYNAEARFLRALGYYYAIDLFGSVPFITEKDGVGAFYPKQISRAALFSYIESELKAIDPLLAPARQSDYGHADQGADWALLARLYLNAGVYTGTTRYTDCITYCNKIINAGYTLDPNYQHMFQADNNTSPEIIFPVVYSGSYSQTYGGTTFLVHCAIGGAGTKMNSTNYGLAAGQGWGGYRATPQFVSKFYSVPGDTNSLDTLDSREMFFTAGQILQINNYASFSNGYANTKWKNTSSTGQPVAGNDPGGIFVDTDWPLFRLAEVFLNYAEAVVQGGSGGDMGTATGYVNQLIDRAYGNSSHEIGTLDLPTVQLQRSRELYWEGLRRTDLIRWGQLTGSAYIWSWKGGVQAGQSVPDYLQLFPIPLSDAVANPFLVQNPGY